MRVGSSVAVVGTSALFLVLALVLSQPTVGVEASNSFSGANSYFLWSLSESGIAFPPPIYLFGQITNNKETYLLFHY